MPLFRKAGEYFVNTDLIQESEAQYRARILASSLLILLSYTFVIVIILIMQYLQGRVQFIGILLCSAISAFYIMCLLALKKTGKTVVVAHAFAIPLYLILTLSSFITGGLNATSSQLMLIIPLILFFTAGAKSGFIWTAIIFATQTVIFILCKYGFEFEQTMSAEAQIEQGFLHWTSALFGIIGIALVYERAHQNLITQRNMRETDNRYLTHHDLLTGVTNRQALEKLLTQHLQLTQRQKLTLTVITLEIAQFQQINARYGFIAGDNILLTLATRLKSLEDIKIVARTNGNQFTLVTFAHDHDFNYEELIDNVLFVASQPFTIGHQIITATVNLGIAFFTNGMMTTDELLLEAEKSLHIAQENNLAYKL